ncbi:MAG: hypothetical protein J1G30_07975 [Spirochaetales bacterium]|nr:hypothetical protein [Spirochaetales bacterium]
MACFLVPLAEGIAVTTVEKLAFHSKKNTDEVRGIKEKIGILKKMLYGGSILLAVEHIYHGELSFVPPFLTAMKSPEETSAMFHEMMTSGVSMALLVTAAWGLGVAAIHILKKMQKKKLGKTEDSVCV